MYLYLYLLSSSLFFDLFTVCCVCLPSFSSVCLSVSVSLSVCLSVLVCQWLVCWVNVAYWLELCSELCLCTAPHTDLSSAVNCVFMYCSSYWLELCSELCLCIAPHRLSCSHIAAAATAPVNVDDHFVSQIYLTFKPDFALKVSLIGKCVLNVTNWFL